MVVCYSSPHELSQVYSCSFECVEATGIKHVFSYNCRKGYEDAKSEGVLQGTLPELENCFSPVLSQTVFLGQLPAAWVFLPLQ